METQTGFQSGLEQLTAESVFEYYDQDRQEALNSTQDIDNILLKNERIILESELRLQQRKREFNTVFGQMLLETLYGSAQYFNNQRILDNNHITGDLRTELIIYQSKWLIWAIQAVKILSQHNDQYSAQSIWNILESHSKEFSFNPNNAEITKKGILGTIIVWNVLENLGFNCYPPSYEEDMRGLDLRAKKEHCKGLSVQVKTHCKNGRVGLPVFFRISQEYLDQIVDSPDYYSAKKLYISSIINGTTPIMACCSSQHSEKIDQATGAVDNSAMALCQNKIPS